jgi:hypothetical protein
MITSLLDIDLAGEPAQDHEDDPHLALEVREVRDLDQSQHRSENFLAGDPH